MRLKTSVFGVSKSSRVTPENSCSSRTLQSPETPFLCAESAILDVENIDRGSTSPELVICTGCNDSPPDATVRYYSRHPTVRQGRCLKALVLATHSPRQSLQCLEQLHGRGRCPKSVICVGSMLSNRNMIAGRTRALSRPQNKNCPIAWTCRLSRDWLRS